MQDTVDAFQKKKDIVVAVLVDLKQAYNHIWRAGLLHKMQKIGIQRNIYHWTKSFLHDLTISTKVNGTTSSKNISKKAFHKVQLLASHCFSYTLMTSQKTIEINTALFGG